MREEPKEYQVYKHFKGDYYQVIAVATHSETEEKLVIYRNLFSGDSKDVILTSSKFKNFKKLYNTAWFSLYSSPSYTARIAILGLLDLFKELRSQRKHESEDIQPRIDRDFKYASIRVGTNVFMSEVNNPNIAIRAV